MWRQLSHWVETPCYEILQAHTRQQEQHWLWAYTLPPAQQPWNQKPVFPAAANKSAGKSCLMLMTEWVCVSMQKGFGKGRYCSLHVRTCNRLARCNRAKYIRIDNCDLFNPQNSELERLYGASEVHQAGCCRKAGGKNGLGPNKLHSQVLGTWYNKQMRHADTFRAIAIKELTRVSFHHLTYILTFAAQRRVVYRISLCYCDRYWQMNTPFA